MTVTQLTHPVLEAAQRVAVRLQQMEEVKRYRLAEEQVNKSEAVQYYIQTIKQKQKELVHAKHYQKSGYTRQLERELDQLHEQLDHLPIVREYQQSQVYVNDLLQMIKRTLLNSVDCYLSVEGGIAEPSGCGSGGACGCKSKK
ncbi:Cell fate regulator YmcA, YheA/YmcA/DUF963 family (controls sporulation, competence, biofilm development) [Seinonella peptonophila]|uniref:Cell fate regulator YmcA, YheA/YmcA/DUF963 family (Controls sporulation, competence, biofilm development) n=1 Tax=Seinonella peptonophila TaxID=112248 RepID=A0A1M4T2F1_9BACL|nr:YlbF family regulator [Seinonella peptonophila]SHE38621.1 Cell fate regulator YmcA, YheA/YmcA/DUF963 family (controls sporulation, competence, biofilm development) [Seinonella peptonophila]